MRVIFFAFLMFVATGCAREISSTPALALPNQASRPSDGSGYKTLYSFKASPDGSRPTTGLVDLNGTFYGTTATGGSRSSGSCENCGTIYSITRSGSEKVIYSFPGPGEGSRPDGGLLVRNGALYGTAFDGGKDHLPSCAAAHEKGCGTIFEVTPDGAAKVIHAFIGRDGKNPNGELTDRLYGTTTGSAVRDVFGTVFIIRSGKLEPVHNFNGPPNDGQFPVGSLVTLKNNVFGVTAAGGADNAGTVFEAGSGGEKVLHSFSGPDGASPAGGLKLINGLLYGVATSDGPHQSGVVFALTPSGSYQIVHAFRGPSHGDGADPQATPILVNGTILYGTTYRGGTHDLGTVYQIDQHGKETVLHSFGPAPDGIHPKASLLWHDGTLYGTTAQGGDGAAVGTVFSLTP